MPQKISIDWTLPVRVIDFMNLTEQLKEKDLDDALNLTGVKKFKI